MPEGVTLSAFTYNAEQGNAILEVATPTQQRVFDLFERLKPSPLFARTEFVTPPARNRTLNRFTSTIRLTFTTNAVDAAAGGAP